MPGAGVPQLVASVLLREPEATLAVATRELLPLRVDQLVLLHVALETRGNLCSYSERNKRGLLINFAEMSSCVFSV